jgi:hypothetical protein
MSWVLKLAVNLLLVLRPVAVLTLVKSYFSLIFDRDIRSHRDGVFQFHGSNILF